MLRCAHINRNGKQCSRHVKSGAVCHIHAGRNGGAVKPRSTDPDALLQQLLRDPKPAIRLKALDMWLKRQETATPTRDKWELKVSDDEQNILRFATALIRSVKAANGHSVPAFAPFVLSPDARQGIFAMLAQVPERIPAPPYNDVPGPHIDIPTSASRQSPRPTRQSDSELPNAPRDWSKAGLFELNGRLTHVRGDEHADRILAGEVPFEDAVAEEQFHQRQLTRMRVIEQE